jgi:group II intron reverse transcriptase/maturase
MSQPALFADALALANLRIAWKSVRKNRGGAGVDDVSLRRFERDLEKNLQGLRQSARENTYAPKRLRRFHIPKPTGGSRTISVPTVADRVLQRAILNVLEWRLDRMFLSCSFGYRPRRSLQDAVARLVAYRDGGRTWALDADIDAFFDSLDHELLNEFLIEDIPDLAVVNLIRLWLHTGCRDPKRAIGIPLGAPLSPLLANLYLHRLDRVLCDANYKVVRYADDFVILCATRGEAEAARGFVEAALTNLRLRLDPEKSRVTSFDAGLDFLGVHFEGDTYSYLWQDKRVTVKGDMDVWNFPYPPEGYA